MNSKRIIISSLSLLVLAAPASASHMGEFCIAQYDPVCGQDGKTYGNACEANRDHVGIVHRGRCVSPTTIPAPSFNPPNPIPMPTSLQFPAFRPFPTFTPIPAPTFTPRPWWHIRWPAWLK